MADHCAVHDIMFSQMAKDLRSMAESLTSSLDRIANQSSSNGDKLEQIAVSQGERKAVCSRQDQRIEGLEKDSKGVWDKLGKVDELADARFNKLWDAVNSLRRIVYTGLGIALSIQIFAKFFLGR